MWESISRKPPEFGGGGGSPGVEDERQSGRRESLSVRPGGLAQSFIQGTSHRAYSVTGTLPPQTAPTQKDKKRGCDRYKSDLLSVQDSRLSPLPTPGRKPLPLTSREGCGEEGPAAGRSGPIPASSHPFRNLPTPYRRLPDGWASPCSEADQGHAATPPSPNPAVIRDSARSPSPSAALQSHSESPAARPQELIEAVPLPK